MKRDYNAPSLVVIGRVAHLTGLWRNENVLDNPSGSDAWRKNVGS